jgi:hypothetical protein
MACRSCSPHDSAYCQVQEWYLKAYQVGDQQLRKLYEIGQLQEGRGWEVPADTFAYNTTACVLSDHCYMRDLNMPASGVADPAPLPDFSYNGDINSTETPPPPGSIPFYIGDALGSKY